MLKVADVPAETLVIRDRSRLRAEGKAFLADDSRNAAIRRVLLALARDAEPEDMTARDTLEIVPLWNEAAVLVRTLEGALRGEKFQLTNVSSSRDGDRRARTVPARCLGCHGGLAGTGAGRVDQRHGGVGGARWLTRPRTGLLPRFPTCLPNVASI